MILSAIKLMAKPSLLCSVMMIAGFNIVAQQKVGVGTTMPVAPFHVFGPGIGPSIPGSTSTGILRIANSNIEGVDLGKMSGLPFAAWMQAGYDGFVPDPISLQPMGGNVGIGTLDPANKLTVEGHANINGNLGINTNLPMQRLDVNGKIKLGNDDNPSVAGTIRWNEVTSDFEGFNGTEWLSLTASNNDDGWPGNNEGTGQISDFMQTTSNDGVADQHFGVSISISGDYAVIGAYLDNIGANTHQGSAYIFIKSGSGWVEQAKLVAADGAIDDFFGISVAISGDYVIVGSSNDATGSILGHGSAYIFIRNGVSWTQQAKLVASDGAAFDYFGTSVDIENEYAIIGAQGDDIGSNVTQGSAYIYLRSGTAWSFQSKLTAIDGAADDNFGNSVSISGASVLIGANTDNIGSNTDQGSAYVFTRTGSTWTQQAKVLASDGDVQHRFGSAVSIEGDYAVVGSPNEGYSPTQAKGSAYIYFRTGSTWSQQAKVTPTNPSSLEYFGTAVCISGEKVIIGAYADESFPSCDDPVRIGLAYIYQKQNNIWTLYSTVEDPLGEDMEGFGVSVFIKGDDFIVSAYRASPNGLSHKGKIVSGKID
jgi:hypothetical protein